MMHNSMYDTLNRILESDGSIRFAGLVDGNGRLVVHGYRSGIVPLSPDEAETSMVKAFSKTAASKVLEDRPGRVEYAMAVHQKVRRVAVPFREHSFFLLISMDSLCDSEKVMHEKVLPALRSFQFRDAIESR
jgi:hypothetical protein